MVIDSTVLQCHQFCLKTKLAFQVENGVTDILVIEARDRTGGRIQTIKHEGAPLDLGAQWVHGGCPANSLFNFGNRFELILGVFQVTLII